MFPKPERTKDRALLNTYHDMRCLVCGRRGAVGHHVKTKKSGGKDVPQNLMPLEMQHHTEVHAIGLTAFADKYPSVTNWLIANGWSFDKYRNKWINPEV